jgi:hypothetical protein
MCLFLTESPLGDPRRVILGGRVMAIIGGIGVLDYAATVALTRGEAVIPGVYCSTS